MSWSLVVQLFQGAKVYLEDLVDRAVEVQVNTSARAIKVVLVQKALHNFGRLSPGALAHYSPVSPIAIGKVTLR